MKCDICGSEYGGEDLFRITRATGDKGVCVNCALDTVDRMDEMDMVDWLEAEAR